MAVERPPRLDLTRPRAYGELLSTSLQIVRGARRRPARRSPIVLVAPGHAARRRRLGRPAGRRPRREAVARGAEHERAAERVHRPAARHRRGRAARPGPRPRRRRRASRRALRGREQRLPARPRRPVCCTRSPSSSASSSSSSPASTSASAATSPRRPPRSTACAGARRCAAAARWSQGSWWRTLGCLLMTAVLVGVTAEIAPRRSSAARGSGALYVAGADRVPGDRGGRQPRCSRRSSTSTCARGTSGGRSPATETMAAVIDRYTRPEIGALWTDEARMEAWRRVEVAACEEMAGPDARRPRGDPRRDVHRRRGEGARAGHRPRRRGLRRRAQRERRAGRAAGSTSA